MARSRRNVPQPKEHSALSIDNVSKSYGTAPALDPISFDINTGDRVALIGHNGSGKTTLIRIAAGLLDSSTGSVSIGGAASGSMSARAALSFIADQPTFYDDLSLWEHMEYVARLHGVGDWEQTAADLLGHLGLYDRADDMPNRFSRGLKQKSAIALGFIRPFDLLLVDEPFVGLDAADHEAGDARFDQGVHARRGPAVMVAGFERRPGDAAAGRGSGLSQRDDLAVRSTGSRGPALADHAAGGIGDHAADGRIGFRLAVTTERGSDGAFEHRPIVIPGVGGHEGAPGEPAGAAAAKTASKRCIDPPRPPEQPSTLPYISARTLFIETPRTSAWPCSR